MKKLLAILLIISFLLSFTACRNSNGTNTPVDIDGSTFASSSPESDRSPETTDFNVVTSLDDFKTTLDESGYEVIETKNEDGSITVELIPPTPDVTVHVTEKEILPTPTPVVTAAPTPAPVVTSPPTPAPDVTTTPAPVSTEPVPPVTTSTPETTVLPPVETKAPETTATPVTPSAPQQPEYTYTTNQTHIKVPYTERYLYSVLNEQQKEWYRKIDTAINNLEERVYIGAELADNENYYIYFLYMFDNPEHFYLGSQIGIFSQGDSQDGLIFCYSVSNASGDYCGYGYGNMTSELKNKIIAKKAAFDAEVNRIISTIPADAPDVVKEKLIYDRILIDSYYNLNAIWDNLAEDNWTAYGVIINKYGVCEAYSEAFQTLCLAVGINCSGVTGYAGEAHKWNIVQLDGEWYMCDITFDDPIGGEQGIAYHTFFNRTSVDMQTQGYDWSNSRWPVPNCTATKYSYANYFGN